MQSSYPKQRHPRSLKKSTCSFCSIIEQYNSFFILAKNKLEILIFMDLFFTKHSLLGKNVQYLNIYE